jgi:hypothetical protein
MYVDRNEAGRIVGAWSSHSAKGRNWCRSTAPPCRLS